MILSLLLTVQAQTVPLQAPQPQYLNDEEIREGLLAADWQSCVPAETEDLTAPVSLRILPTGGVEVLAIEAAEPIASCWSDLLSALQFRAHDEEPLAIEWVLGIHGGSAIPYPAFDTVGRQLRPFFLFIPPDASEESLDLLLQTLEVGEREDG